MQAVIPEMAIHFRRVDAQADEILIGAPYWGCLFPAVLRIYLERIYVNGIVFRYGLDGRSLRMCRAGKHCVNSLKKTK